MAVTVAMYAPGLRPRTVDEMSARHSPFEIAGFPKSLVATGFETVGSAPTGNTSRT